jgi:RES domain-containing protein
MEWLGAVPTAVLCVPSAVIPMEWNYLLNPVHPDFSRIRVHAPKPFEFDSRMRDLLDERYRRNL